jgi:hypothetical protein
MDKHGVDTTDANAALDGGAIKVFDNSYKVPPPAHQPTLPNVALRRPEWNEARERARPPAAVDGR